MSFHFSIGWCLWRNSRELSTSWNCYKFLWDHEVLMTYTTNEINSIIPLCHLGIMMSKSSLLMSLQIYATRTLRIPFGLLGYHITLVTVWLAKNSVIKSSVCKHNTVTLKPHRSSGARTLFSLSWSHYSKTSPITWCNVHLELTKLDII